MRPGFSTRFGSNCNFTRLGQRRERRGLRLKNVHVPANLRRRGINVAWPPCSGEPRGSSGQIRAHSKLCRPPHTATRWPPAPIQGTLASPASSPGTQGQLQRPTRAAQKHATARDRNRLPEERHHVSLSRNRASLQGRAPSGRGPLSQLLSQARETKLYRRTDAFKAERRRRCLRSQPPEPRCLGASNTLPIRPRSIEEPAFMVRTASASMSVPTISVRVSSCAGST